MPAAVAVLAFALRLLLVLRSPGGLTGLVGYDSGVYYAASDALLHGRVPYRDFLLLHPPGLMLTLTPFAQLGRLTTDETGFVTANLAFMAVGAINAALVVRVAQRFGAPRDGAVLGGLAYAVWTAAALPEVSARLEPLGNLLLLVALSLIARAEDLRSDSRLVGAGMLLGLACAVKLWWVVPVVVVTGWLGLRSRRPAVVLRFAAGVGGAFVVVAGPFLALAPSDMGRMLLTDQWHRSRDQTFLDRIHDLVGLHVQGSSAGSVAQEIVVWAACAAVVGLGVLAWVRGLRLPVLLAALNLTVLFAVPHYSNFYSAFVSVPIALVVAGAVSARRPGALPSAAFVAAAAAEAVVVLINGTGAGLSAPFPRTDLAPAVAHVRCLMSDSPAALIALNALSRGLAEGCPNWVDVSGRTYDADRGTGRAAGHRSFNVRWQLDVRRYLRSGDAVILVRNATGLTPANRRLIQDGPLLAKSGRFAVYGTPGG